MEGFDATSILQLMDELKEDTIGGEDDDDEDDCLEDSDESDMECETKGAQLEEEEPPPPPPPPLTSFRRLFYTGRDKKTHWRTTASPRSSPYRAAYVPGVVGFAKAAKCPIEAWQLFFPDSELDEIVSCTNNFIANIRKDYSRERDASDTNQAEIKAVLGLLYLAGIMKSSHQNLADLWARYGTGVEYFHATMSLKRFRFLLYCLRFDNVNDRQERKALDRLAPIRTLFDNFVTRCAQHFCVGNNVTVGEMVEPFRGKCAFRQYINKKAVKYGIKLYALVDSRMYYTLNMEVHAGTQPDGPYKLDYDMAHVVRRLVAPLAGSGRNLTYDRRFSSLALALDLYHNCNLTSVGVMKKNKKEIPAQFVQMKNRPERSSLFGFQEQSTLCSYIPEKGKNLVVLSTLHRDDAVRPDTRGRARPDIIAYHSSTRRSVDTVQELCSTYSVARKSSRWPLTIFFTLLNIAAINSQIILQVNTHSKLNRREYLRSLARVLTTDYLKLRSMAENLPQQLKMRKRQLAGLLEEEATRRRDAGPGRCLFCSSKKNRKTTTVCATCSNFICREHTITTCLDCVAKQSTCDNK